MATFDLRHRLLQRERGRRAEDAIAHRLVVIGVARFVRRDVREQHGRAAEHGRVDETGVALRVASGVGDDGVALEFFLVGHCFSWLGYFAGMIGSNRYDALLPPE